MWNSGMEGSGRGRLGYWRSEARRTEREQGAGSSAQGTIGQQMCVEGALGQIAEIVFGQLSTDVVTIERREVLELF